MPTPACKPTLSHRAARRLGLSLFIAACLAGCGAGLGGTGTGDSVPDLATFGATTASVCSGALGSALGCDVLSNAQPVTALAFFSDSSGTRRATVDADRIDLQLLCSQLQFVGTWGTASGQTPRYYGRLLQGGSESLATLTADALPDGSLELRLFSLDGRLLVGPLVLARRAALAEAVICP